MPASYLVVLYIVFAFFIQISICLPYPKHERTLCVKSLIFSFNLDPVDKEEEHTRRNDADVEDRKGDNEEDRDEDGDEAGDGDRDRDRD